MIRNPYEVLGVPPGASREEIKSAYRDLTKVWHPDRFAHESPRLQTKAQSNLKEINAAYSQLAGVKPEGAIPEKTPPSDEKLPKLHPVNRSVQRLTSVFFVICFVLLCFIMLRAGVLFKAIPSTIVILMINLLISGFLTRALRTFVSR